MLRSGGCACLSDVCGQELRFFALILVSWLARVEKCML